MTNGNFDFNFLREEAMSMIRQVAADTWTDHNAHDPGITFLEAISYALSEIGMKSNLEIEDIMASAGVDTLQDMFLTGTDVLEGKATTLVDLQKTISALPTIQQAWITKGVGAEVPVFSNGSIISYTGGVTQKLPMLGLTNVLIRWSDDPTLGNINSNLFSKTLHYTLVDGTKKILKVELAFPHWSDPSALAFSNLLTGVVISTGTPVFDQFPGETEIWSCKLTIKHSSNTTIGEEIRIIIRADRAIKDNGERSTAQNTLLLDLQNANGLVRDFNLRVQAAKSKQNSLLAQLPVYRNLCEDFVQITAVQEQEIAVYGYLEIVPGAPVESLIARIYAELYQFIEDLAEQFKPHSFTDEGIFLSDVLNLVFRLDQTNHASASIISLSSLSLSNFINNRPINSRSENCLSLLTDDNFIPIFSIRKSNLVALHNGIEVSYDLDQVEFIYQNLLSKHRKISTLAPQSFNSGTIYPLNDYQTIRNDLPLIYGQNTSTGINDLRTKSGVQAAQLKAYLSIFDQVLVDTLQQFTHAPLLFSVKNGSNDTWFRSDLRTLTPDVAYLFNGNYNSYLAAQPNTLLRRSRILDHLIARFGESLEAYRPLFPTNTTETQFLDYKHQYLLALPKLQAERGLAYHRLVVPAWDNDNFSGFERKVRMLLGLPLIKQDLWNNIETSLSRTGIALNFGFQLQSGGQILLQNIGPIATINESNQLMNDLLQHGSLAKNFQLTGTAPNFSIQLYYPDGRVLAKSVTALPNEAAGNTAIQNIIQLITTQLLPREGFHLVEHILLRPKDSTYSLPTLPFTTLPPITLHPEFSKDFYSAQVTIVFPATGERLGDLGFRTVVEKIIRRELPSWIVPHIYWLHFWDMRNFEIAYRQWVQTNATAGATATTLRTRNNTLVNSIAAIQAQYASQYAG